MVTIWTKSKILLEVRQKMIKFLINDIKESRVIFVLKLDNIIHTIYNRVYIIIFTLISFILYIYIYIYIYM